MSQLPEPQHEKLNQLEEALGFLEVQNGRSKEQFEELNKVVHELGARMQRLESRLIDLNERLETQDPGLVPPPHSAGPDIPRDPL
jgi:uncharacterized coiled-coil protein SlyX